MSNITCYIDRDSAIRWIYHDGVVSHIHNNNGPAIEWYNGDKWWWVNGKQHREGGPIVEYANGDKAWWVNGVRHRLNGPAVEYANGDKAWYVMGVQYYNEFEYWIAVQNYNNTQHE